MMSERHTDYDAIVIGSGAGGLASAVCLARAGQRVLVLEQHYLPGGWCHSFPLEGFLFSPGVHYIGQLQEGGAVRELYEQLGVADHLTFLELNPDGYDKVIVGSERFDIPAGRANFEARLVERFPAERRGIAGFLEAVDRVGRELEGGISVRSLKHLVQLPGRIPTIARLGFRSLSSVFDKFGIHDPMLRTILGAQSGDHGMAPDRAAFVLHAAIMHHYFEGGWYPKGGGRSLPMAFIKELRAHGGKIQMRSSVERIVVEGSGKARRAVAVQLADGTEISAKVIVSNADPEATFGKMVGEQHLSRGLRRKLRKSTYSISALSLFLGVDMDIRAAGLDSGNVWCYGTPDLQRAYDVREQGLPTGPVDSLFLTATTLKDRSKRSDGLHTMEAFTFVPWKPFRKWQASQYGERTADYEAAKAEIANHMYAGIERVVPGLRDHVVFEALGTSLTNRHYVASTEGNIYGTEKSRLQLGPFAMQPTTEIDGLFLCGASTGSHGVVGAMISGVAAACRALGCRRRDVLTGTGTLRTEPCEPVAATELPESFGPEDDAALSITGVEAAVESVYA